MKACN